MEGEGVAAPFGPGNYFRLNFLCSASIASNTRPRLASSTKITQEAQLLLRQLALG